MSTWRQAIRRRAVEFRYELVHARLERIQAHVAHRLQAVRVPDERHIILAVLLVLNWSEREGGVLERRAGECISECMSE